jgi:fructose-specific phosphotransferase system IIC component
MRTSMLIARLIGPLMSIIGIGMLVNGEVYRQTAIQIIQAYPFVYFSGILLLAAGLAILNVHHDWTADWRSLITAFGWICTGVGTFRLLAPQFPAFIAGSMIAHTGFFAGAGVVLLAFGGFITFKGYVAEAPH